MEKIILPVASEEGGEAVVPIVEEGDKIIVVVGPGTRLLHRPISNINALRNLKIRLCFFTVRDWDPGCC